MWKVSFSLFDFYVRFSSQKTVALGVIIQFDQQYYKVGKWPLNEIMDHNYTASHLYGLLGFRNIYDREVYCTFSFSVFL